MRLLTLILICASSAPGLAAGGQTSSAGPPIPCVHDWSRAQIARVRPRDVPGYAAYEGLGGKWARDSEPFFPELARIGRCKDAEGVLWPWGKTAADGREAVRGLQGWKAEYPEETAWVNRVIGMLNEAIAWADDEERNVRNERARRAAAEPSRPSRSPTPPAPAPAAPSRPFAPARTAAAARDLKPLAVARNAAEAKQAVDQLLTRVPDRAFAEWASREVRIDRLSRNRQAGDRAMGITKEAIGRPVLTLYDPFFARDAEDQLNLLTFEMAKGLWFNQINPGDRENITPREREVRALIDQHQGVIDVMRFQLKGRDGPERLWDNDPQSEFAYAARVAMLNVQPPSANPDPVLYSSERWARLVAQWPRARADFARLLGDLVEKK